MVHEMIDYITGVDTKKFARGGTLWYFAIEGL